ncbi:ABC transporter substrate-binding protein [Rhizobacter sp. Root1221]|uniref:ABC transporter substrate-binding protein n=1 Tax=Rhizobacter sp. Root1221 TaxID=1736433 RepID=UPI000700FEFD|nr:ABC transporter substrate-binding protein [Rhizobacter sp. Root1221]KQV99777.1 amino acid ABC transporter substrate-binding protein [Rhizobacter sp. Root1221]
MKKFALCAALWAVVSGPAWADIRIGQTAGQTGAVSASVLDANQGAKLYFDAVNARGGVHGEKIQLISLDDKFDPKLAADNARQLIDQGVIALFLNRGTPHSQAIMPLLAEHKVPLVGPCTGSMVLHNPVHPWLFNVRAPYRREAERAIAHLSLIGVDRIAIVHVDDSFGTDAVGGALKGLTAVNKQPLALEKYDRSKPDFGPIMPKIVATDPQAVMFIGSGTAVVDGMKALRAAGSRAQMVTLSNNASSGFIKDLGPVARGVIVSQVFPYERSIASPLVKEAMELAKAAKVELTPSVIEGYVSAKVLVEGLRRASPQPTRDKLRRALETINHYDLGGLELTFSPTDHTGLDYADLSIVGPDGRFQR